MRRINANRFVIGQLLKTEPVITAVKRELKQIADGARIEDVEILEIITNGVLRRDLLEGDQAVNAEKLVKKALSAPKEKKPKEEKPKEADPVSETPKPLSITEQLMAEAEAKEQ